MSVEGSGGTECSKTYQHDEEEEGERQLKNETFKPKNDGGSSSNSTVEESEKKSSVRPYVQSKMPRLRWSNALHLRFVEAVERLGGQYRATPKLVLHLMNIKGLHIAHMYRSKKIDDPSQVVFDPRHFIVGGDRNIYNLSQLPMLQFYNQRYSIDFNATNAITNVYEDASMNGHERIRSALREQGAFDKARPRFYSTVAGLFGRNYIGQENCDLQTSNSSFNGHPSSWRSQEVRDKFGSIHEKGSWQGQSHQNNIALKLNPLTEFQAKLQEQRSIPLDLESTCLEKLKMTKRKALAADLDLNLTLEIKSRNVENQRNSDEEEDNDDDGGLVGNLSLSLYSPSSSKNKRRLKSGGDDHSSENARRASTLDLTI